MLNTNCNTITTAGSIFYAKLSNEENAAVHYFFHCDVLCTCAQPRRDLGKGLLVINNVHSFRISNTHFIVVKTTRLQRMKCANIAGNVTRDFRKLCGGCARVID